MGSVNKVILVGNLGADPDLRYTTKGTPVCHMSVATSSRWKDSEGVQQSRTCWHRVVAWGKQGQVCKEYLRKGRQVYVEGRLQPSSYIDKDGIKRYSTEVVSSAVVFIGNGRRELDSDGDGHSWQGGSSYTAPPLADRGSGFAVGGSTVAREPSSPAPDPPDLPPPSREDSVPF